MKDTELERTKNLSQEMEGVKDEPVQEERESGEHRRTLKRDG